MSDREPSAGAAEDGTDRPVRVWTRYGESTPQDDDGALPLDDLHFHSYCPVLPYDPDDDEELDKRRGEDDTEIKFVSGLVRLGLRHTPIIVLTMTVLLFGSAEFVDSVQGISVFLPNLSTTDTLLLTGGGVLYAVLLALLVQVDVFDREQLYRATVVYGLMGVLVAGTVLSVALVFVSDPTEIPPNIVFTSGYLLMLLLTGLLVYDGMIRTESLFEHLDKTAIVEDGAEDAYDDFRTELRDELDHSLCTVAGYRVRTAHVFAVLFVTQFLVLWWIGRGPQNLDYTLTLVVNVLLNIFIVVVAFQFIVLIKEFYSLVTNDLDMEANKPAALPQDDDTTEQAPTEEAPDAAIANGGKVTAQSDREGNASEGDGKTGPTRILGYEPFHPDGYAGYRELGKLATRVNMLLIVAGFYLVLRLFIHGPRIPPAEMAPGYGPVVGTAIWVASFIIPILAWAGAAAGWLYYSFWHLHLRMIRERERKWHDPEQGGDEWEAREMAPVWPVNPNEIMTIVSGAATPVVLALSDLL